MSMAGVAAKFAGSSWLVESTAARDLVTMAACRYRHCVSFASQCNGIEAELCHVLDWVRFIIPSR